MSLSNQIVTELIDPRVQNNSRTEFRLPEGFLANLRLVDLGVYDTQATAATGLYYPSILGVLASIKKLTLYSGATIIDEIQELPAWASVQHLRTSNQNNESINRFDILNGLGLALDRNDIFTLMSNFKDYRQKYVNSATAAPGLMRHNNQFQVGSAALDKTSGTVSLSSYLGFLQSIDILPNIPDLRLVIDWQTTAGDYYQDGNAVTAVAAPAYVPIRPTLMVDKLVNAPAGQGDYQLPFFSTMVERFVVPSTAVGDQTRSSFRSGAYRARYVKDLTLFNKASADKNWLRAKEYSPAMRGEQIQLVVNGAKYLPDQGIDQAAQKLQYFNETMGPLNLPTAAFVDGLVDGSGHVLSATDGQTAARSTTQLEQAYSVTAVRIEAVIDRLDIEYTRIGGANTNQSDEFTLLAFGRVARQLEVKNGQLRLSY